MISDEQIQLLDEVKYWLNSFIKSNILTDRPTFSELPDMNQVFLGLDDLTQFYSSRTGQVSSIDHGMLDHFILQMAALQK
jgi:hypothetical protein